jgi:hypothetical protein
MQERQWGIDEVSYGHRLRMEKSFVKTLLPVGLGIITLALVFSTSRVADGMGTMSEERPVPYKKMSMSPFRNFLGNWDAKKDPVLYALISTPAQHNALFNPAAVMYSASPFSPDASLYIKEQILVVARVMPYPGNVDTVFEVDRITERDHELALYYRFDEQEPDAKWQGKICLAIRIPKHDYRKVLFIENGKQVGELNTAAGQWSVPARTAEPDRIRD